MSEESQEFDRSFKNAIEELKLMHIELKSDYDNSNERQTTLNEFIKEEYL